MDLLKSKTGRILIESHRGVEHTYPENTWPAIRAAYSEGADFIEVDVQLSADGVPFLHHNYGLADGGRCHELEWEELETRRVGGEKLPLLSEVLAWARDEDARLSLDLKTGFCAFGHLAEAVTQLIRELDCWNRVMLLGWDHQELLEIKKSYPQATTRALFFGRVVDIVAAAKAARCNAVGLSYGVARPEDVKELHRSGFAASLGLMWELDTNAVEQLDVDIVCWGQPAAVRERLGYA
jgi:glycerophosphoryl diester phosphodiesterase